MMSLRSTSPMLGVALAIVSGVRAQPVVGVFRFAAHVQDPDERALLELGVPDEIIYDLSRIDKVRVVERARMEAVEGEVEMGQAGMIAPSTAAEMGRRMGAEYVVVGSVQKFNETLNLNLRIVNVGTASIHAAKSIRGTDPFEVSDNAVKEIFGRLSIALDVVETKMVEEKEIKNLVAFGKYCQGLALVREGNYAAAKEFLNNAIVMDPTLRRAQTRLQLLELQLRGQVETSMVASGTVGYSAKQKGAGRYAVRAGFGMLLAGGGAIPVSFTLPRKAGVVTGITGGIFVVAGIGAIGAGARARAIERKIEREVDKKTGAADVMVAPLVCDHGGGMNVVISF